MRLMHERVRAPNARPPLSYFGLTVITDLPPVVFDQYAIQCSLMLFAAEISSGDGGLPGIVMTTIAVLNFFCA